MWIRLIFALGVKILRGAGSVKGFGVERVGVANRLRLVRMATNGRAEWTWPTGLFVQNEVR